MENLERMRMSKMKLTQENFPSQIASQEWEIFSETHNPLSWEKVDEEEIKNFKYNEPKIVIKKKPLKVKSLDRAVTLNQITILKYLIMFPMDISLTTKSF